MNFTFNSYFSDSVEEGMSETKFKTHKEYVAEILSRWSVQDLIEQSDDDLQRADELFYASKTAIEIVHQGTENLIRWWEVRSGDKTYTARRFKNFSWCSCANFFYTKRACKHLSATTSPPCANCHELSATVGKLCLGCDIRINHFLKQSPKAARVA